MKSDWFVVKTKQPWENDDFYGEQWTINVYAELYISMMNVMLYKNYRFLWWILVGYGFHNILYFMGRAFVAHRWFCLVFRKILNQQIHS